MSSHFYNSPMDRQMQHRRISNDKDQNWHNQRFFNGIRGRGSDQRKLSNPFPQRNIAGYQLDRESREFHDDFIIDPNRCPRQRRIYDRGLNEFTGRKRSFDQLDSVNRHNIEFESQRLPKYNLGISSINRVEEARRKKALDGKAAEERSKFEEEERKKYQCDKEGVVCLVNPNVIVELKRKVVHYKFEPTLVDELCQFHARYQYNLKLKGEEYAQRYSEKQLPHPNRHVCCVVCDLYFYEESEYHTHSKTRLHCEVEEIYIQLKSLVQEWFDFKKDQSHILTPCSKLAERVGLIIKFKKDREHNEDVFHHLNPAKTDLDAFRMVIFERGMKDIWPQPNVEFYCRVCNYCEFPSQQQLDRHKLSARHLEYERHYDDAFCMVCQKHNGDKQAMIIHQNSSEHTQAENVLQFYRALAEDYYYLVDCGEIIPTLKKKENEIVTLKESSKNDDNEVIDNQKQKHVIDQNTLDSEQKIGDQNIQNIVKKTCSDQSVQTISKPTEDMTYCKNCIQIRHKQGDQLTQLLELEHRNRVYEEKLKISEQKIKEFEKEKLVKKKKPTKKAPVLDDFMVPLSGYYVHCLP